MKILLIGGHLTPALAMIDYIQDHQQSDELVFVGREVAQLTTGQKTRERSEVEKRHVPFIAFETGKIHQRQLHSLLQQWGKWVKSLPAAWQILSQQQPDVILSFGGYLAIPLCLLGWAKRIPVVTHEQTAVGGVANRLIGQWAARVALADPQAAKFFDKSKIVVTGNPLRPALRTAPAKRPEWLSESSLPILYITGGSQGARQINMLLAETIAVLSKDWQVIHQCGAPMGSENWQEKLEKIRQNLPAVQRKNYIVRQWIDEAELPWLYKHVQLAVGRSGANTVWELQSVGQPAIFIPLPKAHYDEQTKNAQRMAKAGAAEILSSADLTPESLVTAIANFAQNLPKYRHAAKEFQKQLVVDADAQLYQVLTDVVKS